jgi:transcription initiation factor TFIID subunit TAF12
MDSQVEKILALMADEFIKNTAEFACKLAKHRGSEILEKDDVKFAIERLYNLQVPQKPVANQDRSNMIQTQPPSYMSVSTLNYK